MGLNDRGVEGSFVWTNRKISSFRLWAPKQPKTKTVCMLVEQSMGTLGMTCRVATAITLLLLKVKQLYLTITCLTPFKSCLK